MSNCEARAKCSHWEGDTISGYWLCAKCYEKLPERPRDYRTSKLLGQTTGDQPPPQSIVLAPVAAAQGYTLSQFIDAMVLRLIARTLGGFQKPDAVDYAVEILRTFEEPFGSDDIDWTTAGAFELVDEDMQYW